MKVLFILGFQPREYREELRRMKYLLEYQFDLIIITGGRTQPYLPSEAESLKYILFDEKNYFKKIYLEERSIRTTQNLKYGLNLLKKIIEPAKEIETIVFCGEMGSKKEVLWLAPRYFRKIGLKVKAIEYLPLFLLSEQKRKRKEKQLILIKAGYYFPPLDWLLTLWRWFLIKLRFLRKRVIIKENNKTDIKKDRNLFQKLYEAERRGNYLDIEGDLNQLLLKYPQDIKGEEEQLFRGELLLTQSIILLYKKNYTEARNVASEAVKIFERYNKYDRLSHAQNRVAEAFRFEKQNDKAKEWTEKAINSLKKIYSEEELKRILPPFSRELADALIKLKCFSKAEKILSEAYEMTKETGDEFTTGHLALTFFSLYLEVGEFTQAEKYLKIGEDILVTKAENKKNIPTEIIVLIDWGKLYLKQGETEKGKEILKKASEIAKKNGFDYLIQKIEE